MRGGMASATIEGADAQFMHLRPLSASRCPISSAPQRRQYVGGVKLACGEMGRCSTIRTLVVYC